MVKIHSVTGKELLQAVSILAELRMTVFREWPYLYQGSSEYEARYLTKFATSENALVVLAIDGNRVVGASTACPLAEHAGAFAEPFAERGYDASKVFYFGESVLLQEYRGKGVGSIFFDQREAFAKSFGRFALAAFCAVIREVDDPRRPSMSRDLAPFWIRKGFREIEGLTASLDWEEVDQKGSVNHVMQFWAKPI